MASRPARTVTCTRCAPRAAAPLTWVTGHLGRPRTAPPTTTTTTRSRGAPPSPPWTARHERRCHHPGQDQNRAEDPRLLPVPPTDHRSEERRVGEEWRAR